MTLKENQTVAELLANKIIWWSRQPEMMFNYLAEVIVPYATEVKQRAVQYRKEFKSE